MLEIMSSFISARAGKPNLSERADGSGLIEHTDEAGLSSRASMSCLSEGAGSLPERVAGRPCLSGHAGGFRAGA